MRRTINVEIFGAINDHKLKATVKGAIEDTTGEGHLTFEYSEIPPAPHWHPLNYTDPLVLLPGYREEGDARAFRSLNTPGSFTAECTLDFGDGLLLRKGATINVQDGNHTGGYYLIGTARSGHVPNRFDTKDASYRYEEFLHPAGPGQIMGIGHARWPRRTDGGTLVGDPIEAIVSARYRLTGWNGVLRGHWVRALEIVSAVWDGHSVVEADFRTSVRPLSEPPHA